MKSALDQGPEFVLYAVLDHLPVAGALAALIIVVSFLSYVTAADSSLDVVSKLVVERGTARLSLRLVFALAVGFAAWIMTSLSGIDGVRVLSNLGGLPALFIISAFNVVLIGLGTVKLRALKAAS